MNFFTGISLVAVGVSLGILVSENRCLKKRLDVVISEFDQYIQEEKKSK